MAPQTWAIIHVCFSILIVLDVEIWKLAGWTSQYHRIRQNKILDYIKAGEIWTTERKLYSGQKIETENKIETEVPAVQ